MTLVLSPPQPIPYWLYKLHGLNVSYTCEICGNATYRGPKAFQRHFSVCVCGLLVYLHEAFTTCVSLSLRSGAMPMVCDVLAFLILPTLPISHWSLMPWHVGWCCGWVGMSLAKFLHMVYNFLCHWPSVSAVLSGALFSYLKNLGTK